MKNRSLFKYGAYASGAISLSALLLGIIILITDVGSVLGVATLALGVGFMNTALLLRVMRWEVND